MPRPRKSNAFLFGEGVTSHEASSRWSVLMTIFVTLLAGDTEFNELISRQWAAMREEMLRVMEASDVQH